MEKLKEIWAGLLLIVALLWILVHLILIRLWRQVLIYEPNPVILFIEIAVTILLVVFAIERLIGDMRK